MADPEHLEIINRGAEIWNQWREENPEVRPDLSKADLRSRDLAAVNLSGAYLDNINLRQADLFKADFSQADLNHASLSKANLKEAGFTGANLWNAYFTNANLFRAWFDRANLVAANLMYADLGRAKLIQATLSRATLRGASLNEANLAGANLDKADLREVDLSWAKLDGADLSGADLSGASLLQTRFTDVNLVGCRIYGISAWDLNLSGAIQKDLIITPKEKPAITVDDLEVAQFIYLMLNNKKIRNVIDTITSKAVLILGRFTEERKQVLDALRHELRRRDYLPILFDFDKPQNQEITETVATLAHMSRFIIADVTDAKSLPAELQAIVPNMPTVPVQLLILEGAEEYALLAGIKRYPWVLEIQEYRSTLELLGSISIKVIEPAEKKVAELRNA